MASQRITVAKIGGVAADVVLVRLRGWAEARQSSDPDEWSSEQWLASVRVEVDAFAERLRANSLAPPVIFFVEWSDLWSMGDLFRRWLSPPGGPSPIEIHADRVSVFGYSLPDGYRLACHLSSAGPQLCDESNQFIARLRESLEARRSLAEKSALIVVREVVGGLVTDEEMEASLAVVPEWLQG
ncbi:hypothetical protein [Paludisphaera rhizosphaerae]|uniref:hypothetical protein n=1 Tax=Paludisphaera rhizosphaerae TaxID=2711216 RepID=UPI0013EBD6B0|nr:hypothetical protein [Paludisphaera rhizosphaerae]